MTSRCDSKFSSVLGYSSQSLLFNRFNVGADVLTLCETAKTIATVQDTVYPCCQPGLGLHFSCPFLSLRKNRLEGNMGKNKRQTIYQLLLSSRSDDLVSCCATSVYLYNDIQENATRICLLLLLSHEICGSFTCRPF
jgi:hypothetical protein